MAKLKEKSQDLDGQLEQLTLLFGKGTVVTASSKKLTNVKEWCKTGSISLDLATNGKGIPKGGLCTCILGKESSGKTTLLLHIIAEAQKADPEAICAFCDCENSLDLDYASESIGVDLNRLHLIDRESLLKANGIKDRDIISGEEWIEIACKLLKSNLYQIVGFDSVASLIPMAEITNGVASAQIGRIAALMAKGYRALNSALSVSKSAFVYLNQYRISPSGYGNPFIEPAGEALKYLQALKIEISKSLDKDSGEINGIIIKGKITKSKVCAPYGTFEYYLELGKGITPYYEVMNLGVEYEIITKVGNTYSYNGNKIGVGLGQVEIFLKDNPEVQGEIKELILLKPAPQQEIIEQKEEISN